MQRKYSSFRIVRTKTPGGVTKIVYKKSKPARHVCANCKQPLHGIPHKLNYKFKNLAKSSKRPSRPYSNLCSSCMRIKIIEKNRQ